MIRPPDHPFVAITATASYTPELVLTNDELIQRYRLPIDAHWIESRTGIRSRHWMPPEMTTSDMAAEVGRRILRERGLDAAELDRIVLATISGDHPSPSTATIVARKLGARCPAFDLSAACAGFLYGLDLGAASIRAGEERVLVLAADARSRFVDTSDVRSVVLFADGAAGVLLEPSAEPGLIGVVLGAEGREHMGAHVPAGGARRPTSHETVERGEHFLRVDGKREIFDVFVRLTREVCEELLRRTGVGLDEVDLFITHQGNAFMVDLVLEELGVDPRRAVNDVVHHGNTSGATVPIALDEARRSGRLQRGSTVLLTAVGAGYAFGAALHRF